MHSERCASLGSMLTSSASFLRRLCRSVFLNTAYLEPFSSKQVCTLVLFINKCICLYTKERPLTVSVVLT